MAMGIGIINPMTTDGNCFQRVLDFGLDVCQLMSWDVSQCTRETAEAVKADSAAAGVRVCALWAGLPGPHVWDFKEGPIALGLVPEKYREQRVAALKQWADFAAWLGAPAIITHCGFIPENMTDEAYPPVVAAIKEAAEYCAARGIEFWFETGQETPVVLLRTIERVGTGNLGINLDPANLLLYGKGNPIDALDVFGQYVRNVHVKDGFCPTDGDNLGREVPPGEGLVHFPEFLAKLKRLGYTGELIIEREIEGEQQTKDIRKTIEDLRRWLRDT